MSSLLEVTGLRVSVRVAGDHRQALRGVSLSIDAGESVALVGESGSGKSMLARSLLRILPDGARVEGSVKLNGTDVYQLGKRELNSLRSSQIAMIFQDPRVHTNPVRTIGDFLTEALVTNRGVKREQADRTVLALLRDVGVSRPRERLQQYPHELSGGLLQRVMIAAALAIEPDLIVADEPTTALDVTTQSEVMSILDERRKAGGMALLLITHDLDLAAAVCDRTAVMYAGRIVEQGASARLHEAPLHPYTAGLAASRPSLESPSRRLPVIPGQALSSTAAPAGCPFVPRCSFSVDDCSSREPVLEVHPTGLSACLRTDEIKELLAAQEVSA